MGKVLLSHRTVAARIIQMALFIADTSDPISPDARILPHLPCSAKDPLLTGPSCHLTPCDLRVNVKLYKIIYDIAGRTEFQSGNELYPHTMETTRFLSSL